MLDSPSPHCIKTENWYPISEALSREENRLKKRCHKTNEINNQEIICWLPRGPSPVYTVRLPKSEADWTALSEQICITASEIRGPSVTSQTDWFFDNSDDIQQTMADKYHLHKALLNDPKSASKKRFTPCVKYCSDRYSRCDTHELASKANGLQDLAFAHNMENPSTLLSGWSMV